MIAFKHSLIISSWLISAGSAACLRASSPCWPLTAWGRSRCWVSWCLSGWWYDAWSPACESCWRPPWTPCWCTGSWSGRETWQTVVGVISTSQKSNGGFFWSCLTSKFCPGTNGKCCSSLSSLPHFSPMQLFLTISFLPPSLKRGLKWKAMSRAVARSTVILINDRDLSELLTLLELLLHQNLIIWISRFSFWPMLNVVLMRHKSDFASLKRVNKCKQMKM